MAPLDWTSPQNDALWQDGVKTLFDPCPAGWRVPKGGAGDSTIWANFGTDKSLTEGLGIPNSTSPTLVPAPTAGHYFYKHGTSGATAWYPYASFREPDGYVRYTGRSSLLWTTSRMDEFRKHDFYFNDGEVRCSGGDMNTYANSVRCVRE